MRVRLLQSFLVITTLSLAGTASAHFDLLEPKPSSMSTNGGKGPRPCGPDNPSAVITPVMGGSMLTIKANETVPHPGHYRVALSINSRDELDPEKEGGLEDPDVMNAAGDVIMTGNSASAVIQNPPVFPVIADNLFPHTNGGGMFMGSVAIPNVTCEKCTLQVIEFMAQHGPDYFYRHCADLKITADPAKPLFDPDGMGGGGAGGAGGTGGAAGSGGAGGSGGLAGSSNTSGSGNAGAPAGGAPSGTAGSASSGAPGTGGGTSSAGTGTAPSTPAAEDDGGCSIAAVPAREGTALSLLTGLLVGLGGLARRRNRPE